MNYKSRVIEEVKKLPEERARVALDFVEYLRTREEWDATLEILGDRKLMADIQQGKKEISEGKYENWKDVKKRLLIGEKKRKYRV